jgi:hypothetical protein
MDELKKTGCGCKPAVGEPRKVSSCCGEPAPEILKKSCACVPPAGKSGGFAVVSGAKASYIDGFVESPAGALPRVSHEVTRRDVLGHWAARWGIGRNTRRVAPGIYAFGKPGPEAPVLVTCNYKLTFDHLRRVWKGFDLWVLVLDTFGINVWCAAGKGTFGTEELLQRIDATRLAEVVTHRELILPQLGAPGVSAHAVRKRSGFKVLYGPVRAEDLARFFAMGRKADRAMREVTFSARDRLVLTPIELTGQRWNALKAALVIFILSGFGPKIWTLDAAFQRGTALFIAALVGLLAGTVATPVLLPWVPGRYFSVKGAFVGGVSALATAALWAGKLNWLEAAAALAVVTALSSFTAMNFTGASHYTSPSGVEKEMRRMLPLQVVAVALGAIGWVAGAFLK